MKHLLFALFLISNIALAQDKPAYVLYNNKGKKVSYASLIKQANASDLVLFGEFHNNPISHWLQLAVTKDLHKTKNLILGAEMFEADNQDALNKYLSGEITQKGLDTMARLWNNYKTDYAPLVNFAKENKLPFVATNIPRKYASIVNKKGFAALDTLNNEAKAWMAPLPIPYDSTLATYQNILTMMGEHGSPNLVKAQATKDATMAHFIVKHHKKGSVFVHYNGAYHSDYYEGIGWYLKQYAPQLKVITITTVSQKDLKKLDKEHIGKADFIICVDEDMTTTY
ncbi:MAG: ChaN family lipoprotein [Bacteroidia bacterium]